MQAPGINMRVFLGVAVRPPTGLHPDTAKRSLLQQAQDAPACESVFRLSSLHKLRGGDFPTPAEHIVNPDSALCPGPGPTLAGVQRPAWGGLCPGPEQKPRPPLPSEGRRQGRPRTTRRSPEGLAASPAHTALGSCSLATGLDDARPG